MENLQVESKSALLTSIATGEAPLILGVVFGEQGRPSGYFSIPDPVFLPGGGVLNYVISRWYSVTPFVGLVEAAINDIRIIMRRLSPDTRLHDRVVVICADTQRRGQLAIGRLYTTVPIQSDADLLPA